MSGLEREPIGGTLEKEAMFAVIDDVTYELNYLYPHNFKPNRAAKAALQELCPLQDGRVRCALLAIPRRRILERPPQGKPKVGEPYQI
jgi:hypothetical protein